MRLTKNTWKPDTCGCVLEYEFDADADASERVHTPTKCIKACQHHPNASDVALHHASVLSENKKKNRALEEVKAQVNPTKKDEVRWEFDSERNISIILPESERGKNITTSEEGVTVI